MVSKNQLNNGFRTRLLFVLHNFHNRAGTEEHTKLLGTELAQHYEIGYLFPQQESLILRSHDTGQEHVFGGASIPWPEAPLSVDRITASLHQALSLFQPEVVHLQHFYNWPLDLMESLINFGAPVVVSLHDYFLITPLFTMQGTESAQTALSEEYVKSVFGKDIRKFLAERISYLSGPLSKAAVRITPSNFLRETLRTVYPLQYQVVPHGIKEFKVEKAGNMLTEKLRFGYVGSFLPQKGIKEMMNSWAKAAPQAELHLFGGDITADIPGVVSHGVYNQEDLPKIFGKFEIGVIPSTFPETFSLVLSEMQMAGKPVMASRIGALKERVIENVTGKLFNPVSVQETADTFNSFIADSSWRSWTIPKPRVSSDMANEYHQLYQSVQR